MRFCKRCGKSDQETKFRKYQPGGSMNYYCRECWNRYFRIHRLAKVIYYDDLFELQGGVCAICHQPETVVDTRSGKVKDLAIDIDPKTGKVRRLLCHHHNLAVGFLGDDPLLAIAVAEYLLEFEDGIVTIAA